MWTGLMLAASVVFGPVCAQTLETPWTLDAAASSLQFQSVKNGSIIETSSFTTFAGQIGRDGTTEISVLLDSVDTKVDLRNVRMRFLFFETFQHPQAVIRATVTPGMIADLATLRRKTLTLPFDLSLHGVTRSMQAQAALTLIGDDLVAVSSAEPVTLKVEDFNLSGGVQKLQETANVQIVPASAVSFNFIFRAGTADQPAGMAAAAPATGPSAALEPEGNFDREACVGRFEILSRTDTISFGSGAATLTPQSFALLDQVADIVGRCPDLQIRIAGHTDSVGDAASNQRLSDRRAAAVRDYLLARGVGQGRMTSQGFGEADPIADNATPEGRTKNRRIEFSVIGS